MIYGYEIWKNINEDWFVGIKKQYPFKDLFLFLAHSNLLIVVLIEYEISYDNGVKGNDFIRID